MGDREDERQPLLQNENRVGYNNVEENSETGMSFKIVKI